jgi:hypothetical protein
MEYFHISYISEVPLPYPIINRLRALKESRRGSLGTWGPRMGNAAIALSTKIRAVQITVQRLNKDIRKLDEELSTRAAEVDRCIARKPMALVLRDDEIGFCLVASLDAFLYEARSLYEMLRTFVLMFTRHILQKRCNEAGAERILKKAMQDNGHGFDWAVELRRNRAVFFHETAPWIAMEMTSRDPRHYEILILNKNVADLEKNPCYVTLDEYRCWWVGLQNCATDMQQWSLAMLDEVDNPKS